MHFKKKREDELKAWHLLSLLSICRVWVSLFILRNVSHESQTIPILKLNISQNPPARLEASLKLLLYVFLLFILVKSVVSNTLLLGKNSSKCIQLLFPHNSHKDVHGRCTNMLRTPTGEINFKLV